MIVAGQVQRANYMNMEVGTDSGPLELIRSKDKAIWNPRRIYELALICVSNFRDFPLDGENPGGRAREATAGRLLGLKHQATWV